MYGVQQEAYWNKSGSKFRWPTCPDESTICMASSDGALHGFPDDVPAFIPHNLSRNQIGKSASLGLDAGYRNLNFHKESWSNKSLCSLNLKEGSICIPLKMT